MVFVEGDDYRQLRRPGDDPAQFRSPVRPVQVPTAPDSVAHQYRGENFTTSTWPDTAPSGPQADMSINGVSASTLNGARAASSDGVDDFGLADGPQDLAQNETFGVAMVIAGTDKTDNTNFFGIREPSPAFQIIDADFSDDKTGQPLLFLDDGTGDRLAIESTVNVMDSNAHLITMNKLANSGAGAVKMFVDDMTTDTATIVFDEGFDHANYTASQSMRFFARANVGDIDAHKAFNTTFIEFNEQPYSQQDRLDLKQRAPGL
jgi:hypothetical protein